MDSIGNICRLDKNHERHATSDSEMKQEDNKKDNQTTEEKTGYKDRFWIPRFWDGMGVSGWFPLVARNRFVISPICIGMAILIGFLSIVNSLLWLIQAAVFGRRIDRTNIEHDPIFVIGHWRSGTTLLHELLVRDPRHTFPDTYACFAPNHFLVSGWIFKPFLKWLLPSKRPIDNMPAGWDHPQEDEFAICNMGLPSPYLTIAFPNHPPQCQEYLDFQNVPEADRNRWKNTFLWFLRCITLQNPKRIVLKSPPHTARIRVLLEMFPKAKFVHIVRNPYSIFPSTVNLWKRLYQDEGLQVPTGAGLEDHVYDTLNRMYDAFERDRELLGPGQFCEVRFERLVADPLAEMQRVYDELELNEFDAARPGIEDYFAGQKNYKKNRFQMTPEMRAEIARRWSKFFEKYDYPVDDAKTSQKTAVSNPCFSPP